MSVHKYETPVGAWLWLALVIFVNVFWITADIVLGKLGYETLSTELKEGLHHPLWGPLIAGGLAFTVVAFVFHMFLAKFY